MVDSILPEITPTDLAAILLKLLAMGYKMFTHQKAIKEARHVEKQLIDIFMKLGIEGGTADITNQADYTNFRKAIALRFQTCNTSP